MLTKSEKECLMRSKKIMKDVNDAHKKAATSTLRFGPSTFDRDQFEEGMKAFEESLRTCPICNEPHDDYKRRAFQEMCYKCKKKKIDKEKSDKLESDIAGLTLDQRIARIESILYDHFQDHPQREWVMR
jgi:hypothetical protein